MIFVVDQHLPFVRNAFGPLGDLREVDTVELTPAAVRDANVLIVRSPTRIDRALLAGSSVKFVGTATIGTDHVDLPYLASQGIAFASAPGSNSNSVKEYVVCALLSLANATGRTLGGLSIGIVGAGHVGSKVHQAAGALGMKPLLNDPPLARLTGDPRYVALDELMEADIITLHVPLTRSGPDPTWHLFDAARFARLKKGAVFINTSRGGVVDTESLRNAIAKDRITAVLDVWENEPDIDADLLQRAAIGTPHIAGYSLEGKANAVGMIREAVCKHFGIDSPWDPSAESAMMTMTELTVSHDFPHRESLLHSVVSQCYDITLDDRMLRISADERGANFRKLRSGYRIRREFSSAVVRPGAAPLGHPQILETLIALGFQPAGNPIV